MGTWRGSAHRKRKEKGDMKGGAKIWMKGAFKGYDKGGGINGGFKGDGKGGGFKGFEKGYWPKGGGKGGGYQGTCFKCGKEVSEGEKEIGEVTNEGNPWVVAGIMEKAKLVSAKGRKPMTLEAWMPRKIELKNKYNIFQVEEEKKEAEAI
jgi:hypothetical protein